MIDYEKFHNYLCDVIRYYQEKKTLKGFSEIAKNHHCSKITTELFFQYGLHTITSASMLDKKVSKKIRDQIAKCHTERYGAKKEEFVDKSICTFKQFDDKCDLLISDEDIPPLSKGMLVYIVTKENKWLLDWFAYAKLYNNKLHFSCVCDTYSDCRIYPCTPETRCVAQGFDKNVSQVYKLWYNATKIEVTKCCEQNGEYTKPL